jgi:hypothetical protein
MSIVLCHAVIARSQMERTGPKSEMEIEQAYIDAQVAELARQARRQRIARLTASAASVVNGIFDHLTRTGREAQQRKDLLERLETMPAYMLKDIGVVRDNAGRFCFSNDSGAMVPMVPAAPEAARVEKPARIAGVSFGQAYAAH